MFPGTCDLKGRPLIIFDATNVVKACLDSHQIASVLLYYASLPRYLNPYVIIIIIISFVRLLALGPFFAYCASLG
jgi:hypothetical protein